MQDAIDRAREAQHPGETPHWLAVAIGNTRARIALFNGPHLHDPESVDVADIAGLTSRISQRLTGAPAAMVVITSVNPPVCDAVVEDLRRAHHAIPVMRAGRDLPIPLRHTLQDGTALGEDRALNAIAAFDRAQQACVVIDAGTAVTIDFVDGEGTFHGGAIAPGLAVMLAGLHRSTAQLPYIVYERPEDSTAAFGRDTRTAMRLGVTAALRGALRYQLDTVAEAYGAYPQVVGTGGDVAVLEPTGLVEHVVPDLQLLGLEVCVRKALAGGEEDDDTSGPPVQSPRLRP